MVVSMVSCYLLCWMPYGVMALLGTFSVGIVSPTASVVSSILAKSSTVLNPIIYVLFNNQVCASYRCICFLIILIDLYYCQFWIYCQFYRCFIALVRCSPEPPAHLTLHTEEGGAQQDCIPMGSYGATSPPDSPDKFGTPTMTQRASLQRGNKTLVLVVHCTPWKPWIWKYYPCKTMYEETGNNIVCIFTAIYLTQCVFYKKDTIYKYKVQCRCYLICLNLL